jgi:glutathione S-transferase
MLPDNANARARAITWMFAALSTVEPPILELGNARLLEADKSWSAQHMPLVEDRVRDRLGLPVALAMPTGSIARSARAI